jgi:hypothetical protein
MTATSIPTPLAHGDLADELAAGRPFPQRDALAPLTRESATALFRQRLEFWLAAASGYADMALWANRQGLLDVAEESLVDARTALAQADRYAPDVSA